MEPFTLLAIAALLGLALIAVSGADELGVPIPTGDITNEQLMDLMNVTTRALDKGRLDVALDHNTYEFMDTLLRQDKIEETGTAIMGRIKLDNAGNAQFVDPYEAAAPNVVSTTWPFVVPWRLMRSHFSTERHEILMNAGDRVKLYDYADLKRLEGLIDMCNMIEESFWADAPASNTAKALWGIKVWAGKYLHTADGAGYYGGYPTGWTDVAGIAPCTTGGGTPSVTGGHAKWRNFCAGYKRIDSHFIDQCILTHTRMKFKAPILAEQLLKAPYDRYRIYCNVASSIALGSFQRKRGDDNGPEVARLANGTMVIMGTPIVPTDCLDADTSDPFYFANRAFFKPVVLSGDNLRIDTPIRDRDQSDVFTTFIWLTANIKCTNRRQGIAVCNKY